MKLNLMLRFQVLNMIPKQGSIAEMRAAKRIMKLIEFKPEEEQEMEIQSTDGYVKWNSKGDEMKEFEFTAEDINLLKEILTTADEDKKIPMFMMDFVEEVFSK